MAKRLLVVRMLQLSQEQLDKLCELLPDHLATPLGGRPRLDKRSAIEGIFWILDNGAKWKDLPPEFGTKSSVHRAFQRWVKMGTFESLLGELGSMAGLMNNERAKVLGDQNESDEQFDRCYSSIGLPTWSP